MLDKLTYSFFKYRYIIRNIVGKGAVLAVIPDLLDRIKFRSISRKPFDIDTPGKSPRSLKSVSLSNKFLSRGPGSSLPGGVSAGA